MFLTNSFRRRWPHFIACFAAGLIFSISVPAFAADLPVRREDTPPIQQTTLRALVGKGLESRKARPGQREGTAEYPGSQIPSYDAPNATRQPANLFVPLPGCLPDFSATLATPAGKKGFLTTGKDGRFRWPDGSRARFWGINVSSTRLDISDAQIEAVVSAFARAGFNMVRLEAIDNRNCLLGRTDAPDSRHFDPHYLDRLDRWMDALRRHGLYYYLDLLDFRTFKSGDGVLNADSLDRGARPYAVFDPYLIQLQKDYAEHLLTHRNPYSRLKPIDDPALALVELCNEHGFFLYPQKLEQLVEPYRRDLKTRFSSFLRTRYGSREKLAQRWGQINGFPVLRADEDIDKNSVDLPLLTGTYTPPTPGGGGYADVRRAPGRMRDGLEFLVGLERAWFREMRSYLRAIGLRIPVTAVVSSDISPDVASVAQECDFTAENWYGDGANPDPRPQFGTGRFFGNRNTVRDDSYGGFAPYTAGLRWNNKPVVIREWATPWPNRRRAVSVPECLAYASLQDFDAMLLFGYQTNRAPNGSLPDALNDYAFQSDPSVWGLAGLAGQAFLNGLIRPAEHTVTLAFSTDRLFSWPSRISDLHRLAYVARLNSTTPENGTGRDAYTLTPTGTASDLTRLNQLAARLANVSSGPIKTGVWRSDTGQITRYSRDGVLRVTTPGLRILAGEWTPNQVYALGGLRFSTSTRFGALLAVALDGQPLESSQHIVVKMVSRAENTGEVIEKTSAGAPGPFALRISGAAPVQTFGKSAPLPTRVWLARDSNAPKSAVFHDKDAPLFALWLENGVWELEIKDGKMTLACDTPGINGLAQGQTFTTVGEKTTKNSPTASKTGQQSASNPQSGARSVAVP